MFATVKGNVPVNEDQPAAQHGVLRAVGVIHWGLMTTVFSLSHLAFLLVLIFTGAFSLILGPIIDALLRILVGL